jgi:hypothetical protein
MNGLPVKFAWLLIDIDSAFRAAAGRWRGCDFATEFGTSKINLKGLRASQAFVLARAASEQDRRDWHAAAAWLEAIERDAAAAETEARHAVDLARIGMLDDAIEHAHAACTLERKYHERLLWGPFLQLIEMTIAADPSTTAATTASTTASTTAATTTRSLKPRLATGV